MPDELIDLTKMRPVDATLWTFDKTDLVVLVTTGGVGYLAKEAFKYFFPGMPSVIEQLQALAKIVETCGRAGAESLKVRISMDAKFQWQLPNAVDAKIINENPRTIDLEIVFRAPRRRANRKRTARNGNQKGLGGEI